MNANTTVAIINIGIILLLAVAIYVSETLWPILGLIFMASTSSEPQK